MREVVDDLADRRVEDHVRDRHGVGGRTARQRDVAWLEPIVEHGAAAHLVPIVIFRFDPEDRDGWNVVLARDLFGQLDRRERLQQREHRAAEETRLLAGDDRHGARVSQLTARFDRAWRCLSAPLLRGDHRGDLVPPARMRLRPRDRASPVLTVRRVAGEERGDGAEIVRVIGGELADPREAPHVDRHPHGGFRQR